MRGTNRIVVRQRHAVVTSVRTRAVVLRQLRSSARFG